LLENKNIFEYVEQGLDSICKSFLFGCASIFRWSYRWSRAHPALHVRCWPKGLLVSGRRKIALSLGCLLSLTEEFKIKNKVLS